jgi:ATPase subunit of ABC transporter with duplicated ATPase domains
MLTFFCVSTLNAEIYIWTDEKGAKHYSDHPPENGENYEVQKGSPTSQHDQEADKKQTEAEQGQVQNFIKEADENYEKQQQEEKLKEKLKAEEAEKNRPPTQEEKIAAEQEKLEKKISELEEQPLEYFGSQKNKRVRIGFFRYKLEALLQDPDKYFKDPENFEGNIKKTE